MIHPDAPDETGGPWGLRIRLSVDAASAADVRQIDIVCRHDPGRSTPVDLLTATRRSDGSWGVEVADGAYLVEHDTSDADFTPAAWANAGAATAAGCDVRRRYRFMCPGCDNDVPARAEHLDAAINLWPESTIDLDTLRRMLTLVQ